jgi:hypothetical protein
MSSSDTPPGKPYKGPSGVARDSVWMTNEDLPHDKDVTLVIESVVRRDNVKFQGGRAKEIMLSLKFQGVQRELGLNATNRKVLCALYGSRCADWFGKAVKLFVQQDVRRPDGSTGPAVRLRAQRVDPPPSKAPQPKAEAADEYADIPPPAAEREPGEDG